MEKETTYRNAISARVLAQATLAFSLMAILLTACAQIATQSASPIQPPTQPSAQPSPQPAPTGADSSNNTDAVVLAAKMVLASQLNISVDNIQLVDIQPAQWPDSCLGVQQPGIMCAMHVVDGYKVDLSANGTTYEVRSNLDGSQTVVSP